jgi:exosortase O
MSTIDTDLQPNKCATATPQLGVLAANIAIVGLWLWLYRGIFDYFSIIFTREDFRTNQLVLLGVIVLIGLQIRSGNFQLRFRTPPQLFWPGLILALGGSILYLVIERFFDINTLSASLFALSGYGLLGLWLQPRQWQQGLPAALLLVGVLPFGDHLQTFVGYPVRIITAAVVRDGLAAAGVTSIGVDTILILENGVSQIDLPCSGVKSLWTGMLFLIAATWLERRPLNLIWVLIAVMFAGLLLVANLARVAILVVVGQVAGWQLAAEMLHIPLGVLGFIAACAAVVTLLRYQQPSDPTPPAATSFTRPRWLTPVLVVVILTMGLVYTPRPRTGLAQASTEWIFPDNIVIQPLPLKPDELDWFTRDGAESAKRFRFAWNDVSGSMILVTSSTWRAHHRPERCFEVYGLSIDDSQPHLVNPNFPIRLVALGNGDGNTFLSAAYWFQSATRTTDDYASRIWADLAPQRDRWVLVSILFDKARDPHTAEMQAFYIDLHNAVAHHLE